MSALVNQKISNEAWESEIWFFDEGLAHGDLFIEGGGLGGGNVKALVESHHRSPGRFIFSSRDEGDIAGFAKDSGDGWVLYSKQSPDHRRVALQTHRAPSNSKLGAVLSFADSGATIFDYEKSVVLVGEDVSAAARGTLASVLAEWQRTGGDPLLLVVGETASFDLAGCHGVVNVPTDAYDEKSLARWLSWTAAETTLDPRSHGTAGAGLGETGAGRPVAAPGWAMAHNGGEQPRANHLSKPCIERPCRTPPGH